MRRLAGLPCRGPGRLLGFALEGDRRRGRVGGDEGREDSAVQDPADLHGRLLADELRRVREDDVIAVEPRDRRGPVVAVDLDELHLDLGTLLERRLGREIVSSALGEDIEVVGMDVPVGGDEIEPSPRRLLERREPPPPGPASSESVLGWSAMR